MQYLIWPIMLQFTDIVDVFLITAALFSSLAVNSIQICATKQTQRTRHRASTSMYSLTFSVRVMLP